MLGMSKTFVVILILAAIIGYGTHSWTNFLTIVGIFAVGKIIWNVLT